MKHTFNETGNSRGFSDIALWRRTLRARNDRPATEHGGVNRSLAFIADKHVRPLGVGDLAKVSGLSRRGFFKAFQKHVGTKPSNLLTIARVESAKRLLIGTNLQLSEIARRTGYRSFNTFWVAFRRVAGVAPGKFRRRAKQKGAIRR